MFLICIGMLNLSGLPFTLGFFIKHLLFLSLQNNSIFFYYIYINILFGAFTGIFYGGRLVFNSLFDFKKAVSTAFSHSMAEINNSFLFSNSSVASNISICLIFFFAYYVSFLLLFIYLNTNLSFSDYFGVEINNNFLVLFSVSFDFFTNFTYSTIPNSYNITTIYKTSIISNI